LSKGEETSTDGPPPPFSLPSTQWKKEKTSVINSEEALNGRVVALIFQNILRSKQFPEEIKKKEL
jgi:hypothetical protein